jgi:protein-ribulosamine 3-kinase
MLTDKCPRVHAYSERSLSRELRMPFEAEIRDWMEDQGHGGIDSSQSLDGGGINEAFHLTTDDGGDFFLKRHADPPPRFFEMEAVGLSAMRDALRQRKNHRLRIPEVYLWGNAFLLLEYLEPCAPSASYWEELGRGLADLHGDTRSTFGFTHDSDGESIQIDNYCGLTPQPNPPLVDGYEFFSLARLLHQAKLARDKGLLQSSDCRDVETVCQRLPELIPEQPASLLHGDLWSGNAHTNSSGEPALIDPAAHWGWAEADIAMTRLFGGFPAAFYQAYAEARPLHLDWEERLEIYNLYHILNHANLFGQGYASQARSILQKYR